MKKLLFSLVLVLFMSTSFAQSVSLQGPYTLQANYQAYYSNIFTPPNIFEYDSENYDYSFVRYRWIVTGNATIMGSDDTETITIKAEYGTPYTFYVYTEAVYRLTMKSWPYSYTDYYVYDDQNVTITQ
ncbi:MAG: hypothetical protein CVU00_11735 [Bacteroidetes bacterium HGW-Bacteroidetes-17]|jgi:hypothetical protein|nr:MAG: hypothetical protein CVU00_11735 [Bacteroidetes bacterium HGW-Bacteroidetes-17]